MSPRSGNTRKTYIIEALRLFAERGYEAVGVVEIAQAVGCTTSALYKHFSGKQELFDAILDTCRDEYAENMSRLHVDFSSMPRDEILTMTADDMVRLTQRLFLTVLESEPVRLLRKLATVEQFKNPELAQLYNENYIDRQYASFEKMMQTFIDGGVMKNCGAHIMAVQLISPVIVLVGVCDRAPERKDEALRLIEEHVRRFNDAYRMQ